MPANLELKVRCSDLARVRERARRLATACEGEDRQQDTYFRTVTGRLKLRRSELAGSQLIAYRRPDRAAARRADYQVVAVPEADALEALLAELLGIHRIVRKQREIYWFEDVRIHLDRVESLGDFVELEALLDDTPGSEARQAGKLERLTRELGIAEALPIAGSYETLLGEG